jgi:hypothetical protein
LEYLDVDGRIKVKSFLNKWGGDMDWFDLAQDRDRWRTLVSAVKTFRALLNAGNFLTSFSGRILLREVIQDEMLFALCQLSYVYCIIPLLSTRLVFNNNLRCSITLSRFVEQNCEKRQLASSCPSVRMEQLGSHWTDFHEI